MIRRTSLLLMGVLLALLTGVHPAPVSREALAYRYAPVIYQFAASDQDYITAFDFDGDWVGNNNWEHQPTGDLSAVVYYAVAETETHWFLFYALFHPRDYILLGDCATDGGCHENDLEALQLVVEQDGSPYGQLVALETLAHGDIYLYLPDDGPVAPAYLPRDGPIQTEAGRPLVYVEAGGHGIHGRTAAIPSGLVVYRVGRRAERPQRIPDPHVAYRLRPIYDTLWAHRTEMGNGRAFDRPFSYRGHILPAALDGDDYGLDKANTPWGYPQATGDLLERGDWFLDPARALAYHARFSGPFSRRYLHNPFLNDLVERTAIPSTSLTHP